MIRIASTNEDGLIELKKAGLDDVFAYTLSAVKRDIAKMTTPSPRTESVENPEVIAEKKALELKVLIDFYNTLL